MLIFLRKSNIEYIYILDLEVDIDYILRVLKQNFWSSVKKYNGNLILRILLLKLIPYHIICLHSALAESENADAQPQGNRIESNNFLEGLGLGSHGFVTRIESNVFCIYCILFIVLIIGMSFVNL